MRKKWLLSVSFLILIFVIAACSDDGDATEQTEGSDESAEQNPETSDGTEQGEVPEPDLADIPDVVAEVNGEEISKEEFEIAYTGQFQQALMQAQMSGQEVDQDLLKTQMAEGLIGQKLIIQAAENGDLEASTEEIDETLDNLVAQNGLESQDDFLSALEEQGIPEEEVMSQVETQVKVDKLIANKAGDVEPTTEELEEMYDTYTTQLKQMSGEDAEIPTYEDMESDLIAQVKANKENEAYQTLIEELQAEADITNHI